MKFNSKLWMLAVALATVGCQDDIDDSIDKGSNGANGPQTYMKVNINTETVTKAPQGDAGKPSGGEDGDDFEVGEKYEYNVDDVTITRAEDTKQISTIGVRTKSNVLKYDWVGTSEAWTQGRTSGTIADDWWCYITDDGKSYVEDENAQSYATVDYVDEMVDLAKTELQTALDEYSTVTNTRLSALELTDTRFETRIAAIETAMSERIDRINGEVID